MPLMRILAPCISPVRLLAAALVVLALGLWTTGVCAADLLPAPPKAKPRAVLEVASKCEIEINSKEHVTVALTGIPIEMPLASTFETPHSSEDLTFRTVTFSQSHSRAPPASYS